jgi:hypothetical protein
MPVSLAFPRWATRAVAALAAASVLAPATGADTPPPRPARADPLDPQAPVPPVVHRSAFDGYRRFEPGSRVPWPVANETVNRLGGWRHYAREAAQPEPGASAPRSTEGHR